MFAKEDQTGSELSSDDTSKRFTWLPWRRPNPRDRQITQLREGYVELVDLVRNINRHLDRQQDEATQVSGLVQSLPPSSLASKNSPNPKSKEPPYSAASTPTWMPPAERMKNSWKT